MGMFRAEERRASSRNVPGGEERGETDVFAGLEVFNWHKTIFSDVKEKDQAEILFKASFNNSCLQSSLLKKKKKRRRCYTMNLSFRFHADMI